MRPRRPIQTGGAHTTNQDELVKLENSTAQLLRILRDSFPYHRVTKTPVRSFQGKGGGVGGEDGGRREAKRGSIRENPEGKLGFKTS